MKEEDLDYNITSIYADVKSTNGKVAYIENQLDLVYDEIKSLKIIVAVTITVQIILDLIIILKH